MLRSSGNAVLLITPKSKVQKKGEEWGEEEEEQETRAANLRRKRTRAQDRICQG
jgi:hypothetical protein